MYFFYSGHGADVEVPDGHGGTRLTSAIVPSDARSWDQFIRGDQIGALLNRLTDRRVTIIADSCHSGSISRDPSVTNKNPPPNIKTITPYRPFQIRPEDLSNETIVANKTTARWIDTGSRDPGRAREGLAVWSAASLSQFSYDGPNGGVFTNAFIDGLKNRKADTTGSGKVTASQVLAYVREVSNKFCPTIPDCQAPRPDAESCRRRTITVRRCYHPIRRRRRPARRRRRRLPGPALIDLATNLLGHQNDFGLTAEILPGQQIRLGSASSSA